MIKNLTALQETQIQSPGREDPLKKGIATHSSTAWEIPRTEEPGGLIMVGLKSQTGLSNSHCLSISLAVSLFKFLILSWFSLGRLKVSRIYPFLLGCPICWYIIVYSICHNSFYIYGINYNDSLFSSSFETFLLFLLYLGKWVSILFSFSKQH